MYACTSYRKAMTWLENDIPDGALICGVLVDLMLCDRAGTAAVDRLSALPIFTDVPMISWIGIDMSQNLLARLRKSPTPVWQKPSEWLGWSGFIRRFHDVLGMRTASSSTGLPAVDGETVS